MTAASDQRNPCPQSCWLSSDHLTLLAANKSDWFRDGIFVAKFHTSSSYIHFQPNGCVSETCTLLPARAPCVLGLMTRKSFHFVLARPCPYSNSQRVSSSVGSSCGSVASSIVRAGSVATSPVANSVPATVSSLQDLDPHSLCNILQFFATLPAVMGLSPLSRGFRHIFQQVDFLRLLHVSFQACSWNHACALHSA